MNDSNIKVRPSTLADLDGKLLGRSYLGSISGELDSLEVFRIYIGDPGKRGKDYGHDSKGFSETLLTP